MIELLIFNSLIIWGVFTSIQEGMIFGKVGNFIRGKYHLEPFTNVNTPIGFHLPEWIKKPLAICPICMASVYGTPVFWGAYLIDVINSFVPFETKEGREYVTENFSHTAIGDALIEMIGEVI